MFSRRRAVLLLSLVLMAAFVVGPSAATAPTSATIAGDLQSELGCPGDWAPDCAATDLTPVDGVFARAFTVPAGDWQYKVALNHSWDESYGAHTGSANISLAGTGGSVTFAFDPVTHWAADSVNALIVTAPGSYQSELGCSGDWQPDCLKTWLEDPDGDGIYTFETRSIPAGSYETKAAINRSWDVNYGAGGAPGGANIAFTVSAANQRVIFSFDSHTHVLSIQAGHGADGNVEWDGLRFDSRDTLYRTPQGAVPAGTSTTLRFRTFHDDVTGVTLRDYSTLDNAQQLIGMTRVASAAPCYQTSLAAETCDFWQATLPNTQVDVHWFRFVVSDGASTAYYGDDTAALDGGLGATTATPRDWSYALTAYDPSFTTPAWARNAVVYQIFPDRFRNGDTKNDPKTGDVQYDQTAVKLPWNALPEGYCRSYSTPCPPRSLFGGYQSADREGPQGRDYYGGDLKGVRQSLEQLRLLGFDTIYLNPIFWSKSNHGYDTADYKAVNPYFGTQKEFDLLVQQAHALHMHIILDGVFNHMSSDSPLFDRYHHAATVGACESTSSAYRDWFVFTNTHVPCTSGDYSGWFNFDSIPVLAKANPAVFDYFVGAQDSVTRTWLKRGADGWRLDVMGDSSFPADYWTRFRQVVKATDPDALIVGELWPKDSTTLSFLAGQRADSTMNYRDRDAILGFLTTHTFDGKGMGDSGRVLAPSEFLARLVSQQEDYAAPAYGALMNLIDSHDTTRALWTLSAGAENDAAAKAADSAGGKQRLRLASLVQYTLPGMPTVYYGDEVGVTGSDDPDNRRTYPWPQEGGKPDVELAAHYGALGLLRAGAPVLRHGSLVALDADDAAGTVAYGRKTGSQAAIVAIDKGEAARTVSVPTAGFVPDGTTFRALYGVGNAFGGTFTSGAGAVRVPLAPLSGVVLVSDEPLDLTAPAAPSGLDVTADGPGSVSLAWTAVPGASSYAVYRSLFTGGGYVRVATTPSTTFADSGLPNGVAQYYAVRALDAAGNESDPSNEVRALPHLAIDWSNLQWPPSARYTLSVTGGLTAYGQVYIAGATEAAGRTPSLDAQLGYGPAGSDPHATSWTWLEAGFNGNSGNNDEFVATINPQQAGSYDYAYRYTTTAGRDWVYADLDGSPNGYSAAQAGKLTIDPSADTTPAAVPAGLHVTSSGPASISLAWDPVAAPDLYGYEVLRADVPAGLFAVLDLTPAQTYTDTTVAQGHTYTYVIRSVDTSWNRSANSTPVTRLADVRQMSITFAVTVPVSTDATGRAVHIAGTFAGLGGVDWDPTQGTMTRVDATHWSLTVTGKEGTQAQYKYVLGDWNYVEKGPAPDCAELNNRETTLTFGSSGSQTVSDTVANWRNVTPCGN
jgi:glycosidase/fibronectin type 3 domain-containing protein